MHKRLIPSYNKDFYAFFGDGWDLARPKFKTEYELDSNDMFVFLFTHFAKHYRDSGIGIIHMCDLYLCLKKLILDFDYIFKALEKLHLVEFYKNIEHTLSVWFDDEKSTDMSEHITDVILNSGVYGLCENNAISKALKHKRSDKKRLFNKVNLFISNIFPSYSSMKNRHPVLTELPIFLPLFWIVRWFDLVFRKRERIVAKFNEKKIASDKNINEYDEKLKYVGLKYNF